MTFAPPAIFCEDCHRLTPADDVERRPHGTVLIAECRCGHVVSRVFPTLLSRASSRPPARDGASRANRPSRLRRSRRRTRKEPLPDQIAEHDRLVQETPADGRRPSVWRAGVSPSVIELAAVLEYGVCPLQQKSKLAMTPCDAAMAPTTPGSPPAGASRRVCSGSVTTAQRLTSRPGSASVM